MTQDRLIALVSQVWAETLQVPTIDDDADFFALGGNSLHAVHILGKLEEHLGVHLSVRALLESRTPRRMAQHIAALADRPAERA